MDNVDNIALKMLNISPNTHYNTEEFYITRIRSKLAYEVMANSRSCYSYNKHTIQLNCALQELTSKLESLGFRTACTGVGSRTVDMVLVTDNQETGLWISVSMKKKSNEIQNLQIDSLDEVLFKQVCEFIEQRITETVEHTVYVLSQIEGSLEASPIADFKDSFIAGNYGDSALSDFNHVVSDLSSDNPCGRVIVIEGPPGTGKTHMMQSIIAAVSNAKFLLIPPAMVSKIGDPNMISVIMGIVEENKPLVFIIEDADVLLADRKFDNIDGIVAILGMGDGILGKALNIRLVVSTNQRKMDIDPAILRPGRLCRQIHVGFLSTPQANTILDRLGGGTPFKSQNNITLADVYQRARK